MKFEKLTNYQFKLYLNRIKTDNKIIALDLGTKSTGVAISDSKLKQPYLLRVIKSSQTSKDEKFYKSIQGIVKKQNIKGLIVGHCEGEEFRQRNSLIIQKFEKFLQIPYTEVSEEYSTVDANQILLNFRKAVQNFGHIHDQKNLKDGLAAMIIMQRFLLYYNNQTKLI